MCCFMLQLARAEGRVILTAGQPYQSVSVCWIHTAKESLAFLFVLVTYEYVCA